MEHPTEGELLRFLLGATSRRENRQIVRHLLTQCSTCAATMRALSREPMEPGAYDEALARFGARLKELTGDPQPRRAPAVAASPDVREGGLLARTPIFGRCTPRCDSD